MIFILLVVAQVEVQLLLLLGHVQCKYSPLINNSIIEL